MFEFIATGVGRNNSRVGNLLLDFGAAIAALVWLVVDVALRCRSAIVASVEGKEPIRALTFNIETDPEQEEEPEREAA
jgi:hypothetical protein